MPALEPKALRQLIDSGKSYPVIWMHGPEQLQARELLKRLRAKVRSIVENPLWSEESIDAHGLTGGELADRALTPLLGGYTSVVVVRDADLIKNLEDLEPALTAPAPIAELPAILVLFGKTPDARKKSTKLLNEKAAVVECAAVPDYERESWIDFLAKRRSLALPEDLRSRLLSIDPWSLDAIEQELEKLSLETSGPGTWTRSDGYQFHTDHFLRDFFERRTHARLAGAYLAQTPEEALPLLGLLTWHVRQLILLHSDPGAVKLSSSVRDRLEQFRRKWTLPQLLALQDRLVEADFGLKQGGATPLGVWDRVLRT